MAKKTVVTLIDDLDGSNIEEGKGRAVSFALDGKTYSIDLADKNIEKLEKALSPFIEKASRVANNSRGGGRVRQGGGTGMTPDELNAVREWARANGHEVADRGRIKQSIIDEYNAAN